MNRRTFLRHSALALATALPLAARAGAPRQTRWQRTLEHNRKVIDGLFALERRILRWEWIVIHHTAVEHGSLKGISRYHRKRFDDPLGIQYHFLVNNGKKQPIGLIEPARWVHQARGIHLFHPERAPRGIAISLMGNFEKRQLKRRELEPLVELTRALMKGCGIDVAHVTTHRQVDGRLTQCPGKHFPTKRFLSMLG